MKKMVKTGMPIEEFCKFQEVMGLTDEKIREMTSAELLETIDKYQKQKKL